METVKAGPDVNLRVHLVRGALKGAFDVAAVLTNDTDLIEALRIVGQEVRLAAILLTPVSQPAPSRVNVVSSVLTFSRTSDDVSFTIQSPLQAKAHF